MAGLGVLAILFGCVTAWAGYNDLSFLTVVRAAMSGKALPAYSKGDGGRKALAEVIGFELVKAAAQGASALLPAALIAGKGGAGGGGDSDSGEASEDTPLEEIEKGAEDVGEDIGKVAEDL